MRMILRTFVFIFFFVSVSGAQQKYQKLDDLLQKKHFFQLKKELIEYQNDNSSLINYYRGITNSKFGKYETSEKYLKNFINNDSYTDTSKIIDSYETIANNYFKTYRYKEALNLYEILLAKYSGIVEKERKADFENMKNLLNAIKDVKPQRVVIKKDTRIKTSNHILPIDINGNDIALPFDTGANISVIIKSHAEDFGIKIMEGVVKVGSITGEKVDAHMGVADKISLGNGSIELYNVIFLVFKDEDMYVKQADFQLQGVIGFPLMEGLNEITLSNKGEIFVPKNPGDCNEQNMFLKGLNPVIKGNYKGKDFPFLFDSGADDTIFYQPFYLEFKNDIESNYSQKQHKLTGVGGTKEISAFGLKNVEIIFSGKVGNFKSVDLLTEKTTEDSKYFYGNIGQDLIQQFDSYTINFKSFCISFN